MAACTFAIGVLFACSKTFALGAEHAHPSRIVAEGQEGKASFENYEAAVSSCGTRQTWA